jgi:hypothetical protein
MLSFMRDQQEANQAPAAKGQAGAEANAQAGTQEFLTVAGKTQKTRQSTVVVIILFVVGLAAVGVMVKKSQPKAAAAAPAKSEETQIEAAISRLTGVSAEMTSRMDQIVEKFHEFSAVVQVAVDELAKNPFELEASRSLGAPTTVTPPPLLPTSPATQVEVHMQPSAPTPAAQAAAPEANLTDAEAARRRDAEQAKLQEEARRAASEETQRKAAAETARQQYQQQVTRKAGELKLQSILQSTAGACCLINDTLVRVGDRVKGFQVTQISDNSVHLLWSEPAMPEMTIVLKLTE